MIRMLAMTVALTLVQLPGAAVACESHLMINPDNLGFFGRAVVKMSGLAPPEPVFDMKHPSMVKANIGEMSEVVLTYSRPFFSKNVTLRVVGSNNINLLQEDFVLEERDGEVRIPYTLGGSGFDTITLTVSGEHKGEIVQEQGRIYVRALIAKTESKTPAEKPVQVSAR